MGLILKASKVKPLSFHWFKFLGTNNYSNSIWLIQARVSATDMQECHISCIANDMSTIPWRSREAVVFTVTFRQLRRFQRKIELILIFKRLKI